MKSKIAVAAIISILLISTSHGLQSEKTEFQIQIEKQKAAIEDMHTIAIGVIDYAVDIGKVPDQTGKYDKNSEVYKAVCPFYMETLPIKDPWGNNYLIFCGKSCNSHYGISKCGDDDFVVICLGMDGEKESWKYNPSDPLAGMFKVKGIDDFNKDLISWSGSWIRAPEELLEETPR